MEEVCLQDLGICKNCSGLIVLPGLLDAVLRCVFPKCSHCRKSLSHDSFGFSTVNELVVVGPFLFRHATRDVKSRIPVPFIERVAWVGKQGKWVEKAPKEPFHLGKLQVKTSIYSFSPNIKKRTKNPKAHK